MKRNEVSAIITTDWNQERNWNCKFLPGDRVQVVCEDTPYRNMSKTYGKAYAARHGEEGTIWAATCGPDGKLRSRKTTWYGRCYTRYYVEFADGTTRGYHSNHLRKV